MKNCPKCGKELADTAKFCGGCGTKLEVASDADEKAKIACPKCGTKVKNTAKFCPVCGSAVTPAPTFTTESAEETAPETRKDFSLIGGYIHWNVLPGQIAVKIDENDIAAYGKVKGVSVQDGVKALFFVQGKLIAELDAGNYSFKEMGTEEFTPSKVVTASPEDKASKKKNVFSRFISAIADHLPGKHKERAAAAGLTSRIPANIPPVNVVLVRSTEFPFVFDFKNVGTANIRSEVGVSFLCKITNINEFYANQLVDRKFVCFESISKTVEPVVANILNQSLVAISPDKIEANGELQNQVLQQISAKLATIYEYITVTKLITLSAKNEELEVIRRKREELYISELELAELTRRNNFLNRLKDAENNQLLQSAQTQVEFEAAMEKIDEQHEMNVDEREKFLMMLATQKKLRQAKNDDEIAAAMLEFKKNGLLRDEELDNLEFLIKHNKTVRDMDENQALTLATMENEFTLAKVRAQNEFDLTKINALNDYAMQKLRQQNDFEINRAQIQGDTELDKLKLQREMEVGNARIQNELNRQRMQDEYTDSRFDKELEQKRKQNQLDDEEMEAQMRRLKMAQEIRQQNESFEHNLAEDKAAKEHQRAMEAQNMANVHEQTMASQEQKHEEEMRRMFQGMSAEQIMAANPNITPEAAAAFAAKFSSESKDELLAARQADQDKMFAMMQQQMQMMQQMGMAGIQSNALSDSKMMQMKQDELDRTRADANANQDRFLSGMQTTIQSVGGAMKQPNVVFQKAPAESEKSASVCPNCGTPHAPGEIFCQECGTSL